MNLFKKSNSTKEKIRYCSFCGKNENEVVAIINGPNVFICNECIELCHDIVEENDYKEKITGNRILAPFSNEELVSYSVTYDEKTNEVQLLLNQMACIAFSNIITQLGVIDFDKNYIIDFNSLGYDSNGVKLIIGKK